MMMLGFDRGDGGIATLGFGDIKPAHALAKSFFTLEALIGVLYPVVFLG